MINDSYTRPKVKNDTAPWGGERVMVLRLMKQQMMRREKSLRVIKLSIGVT